MTDTIQAALVGVAGVGGMMAKDIWEQFKASKERAVDHDEDHEDSFTANVIADNTNLRADRDYWKQMYYDLQKVKGKQ